MFKCEPITQMKFNGTGDSALAIRRWTGIDCSYQPLERIGISTFRPFLILRNPNRVMSIGDELRKNDDGSFTIIKPKEITNA